MKKLNLLLFSFMIALLACSDDEKETEIKPSSSSKPDDAILSSFEYQGKTYRTVKIGSQTWFTENLNAVPNVGNSWCYGETKPNCDKYGKLYDWEAAKNVCPDGWKLPSKTDFDNLFDYVKENSGNSVGYALKSKEGWSSGGSNMYNFSALPGGYREGTTGNFTMIGEKAYWWSSSETNNINADYRYIKNDENLWSGYIQKTAGLSVRCIK